MSVKRPCPSSRLARRMIDVGPSAIRRMLEVAKRPGMISLAGGTPASDLFDVEPLASLYASVMRDEAELALQYGATTGPLALREAISGVMFRRGAAVDPGRVIVTTGAQQALDLIARILINPGDVVFVERPTYATALQTLRLAEAEVRGVYSSQDGMDPIDLATMIVDARAQGRTPRLIYLVPNFSNPAGWLVSAARRRALLDVAAREELTIVEDDPYGELFFDKAPPLSLLGLSQEEPALQQHVVYLGSLSKLVSPGMRVGWAVVPSDLVAPITAAKQGTDLQSSTINQHVAARYLASGRLDERLPILRAAYASRARVLCAALREHVSEAVATFVEPQGGMFVWISLAPGFDANVVVDAAIKRGMVFVPGSSFFAESPLHNTLRLTFAAETHDRICDGVRRLGDALSTAHPLERPDPIARPERI